VDAVASPHSGRGVDLTVAEERAQVKDVVDAVEASGAGPGPARPGPDANPDASPSCLVFRLKG
jgi:hypothetical protein